MKVTKPRKKAAPASPPPKRPRRKAALKGTSSSSNSPISSSPDLSQWQQQSHGTRKKTSPRPLIEKNQNIRAEDIYEAVSSGKNAMLTVVDEWLDSYKQNQKDSFLVLINFIVQSCGCKGVVSSEMFDNLQNAEIIGALTKDFNEDSVNYPLSTPGPQLKRFKAGLCEFAQLLVYSCRNSLIYDEYLFPSLLALLTGLSDSQVRAFRHTSTLLAMKLMTGLVKVFLGVSIQLQTAQRRCDIECSKRDPDRASDRLEELKASISELHENKEEVSSMMNGMFRGVFVHRYRDQLPEIRAICIEELGIWLKLDPEHFLNDKCLKYLGWTLHDKRSSVRLQCVRALQGLYQEKEFIGRLELFTSRFKVRNPSGLFLLPLICLCVCLSISFYCCGVSFVFSMYGSVKKYKHPIIIFSPFLFSIFFSIQICFSGLLLPFVGTRIWSWSGNNCCQLLIVNKLFRTHEEPLHEHAAYLVDSLWDVAGSELRDWERMTFFLLQDCGEKQEGALIDLMICTIKQAALAVPPVGRSHGKKVLKAKKIQEQDRRRLTTHFIPLLPLLLAKYSADAEKVSLLLKAPLYFDLEMYSNSSQLKKHLDLLLVQICGIVEKHTELPVLQACAQLACTLCSDSYTFSSRAHLVFSQLLDSLVECFNTYLSGLLQVGVFRLSVAWKLASLAIVAESVLEKYHSCVHSEQSIFFYQLIVSALKCAAFHLMWAKVNAVNSTPTEAELKHLKMDVRSYCKVCQICLSLDCTEIRDQAFELLCDLLLLYSPSSARSTPTLQTLVYLPSDSLRCDMSGFLIDYIFSDDSSDLNGQYFDEMKITLLQKKRNQLAGYCKLVIYGVLDLVAATDVFKHYSKCFNDFGDLIKETISKSKQINPVQSAKTVCLSLQQMFSEMLTEDPKNQNLGEIRELAKRLAMSFGIDLYHVREPLAALHMDGIRFAFHEPQDGEDRLPNVAFLEILSEFSFKLLQADHQCIIEKHPAGVEYPHCYWGGEKKKVNFNKTEGCLVSESGSASSSWLDSPSISSRLHHPALTSTMQKLPEKPSGKLGSATDELSEPHSEDEFSGYVKLTFPHPTMSCLCQ
uniref:Cohesin subunit SA n=1 Tax=Takifugu rubripes TaxID=31033 RepID=A0A674M9Y3_TAKRU